MRSIIDATKYMAETYPRNEIIRSDSLKRCSDMTKAHAMHKPYTNDFQKSLDEIARRKLDDAYTIPGIGEQTEYRAYTPQ